MSIGHGRNRNRLPEERVVGWGKYRFKKMKNVPTEYLEWFVAEAYPQMIARKAWAKEELQRRESEQALTKEL